MIPEKILRDACEKAKKLRIVVTDVGNESKFPQPCDLVILV